MNRDAYLNMTARILIRPAEHEFVRVYDLKVAFGELPLPGDRRAWILGTPLVFQANGREHTVPPGFVTDGASIPAPAQWITGWKRWDPPQRWAGIAHDWLYSETGTAKAYADSALRAILRAEGATWFRQTAMFWAVHLFGNRAYRSNQQSGPLIYNE